MSEKNELIRKLEAISVLYKKLCQLQKKMNEFVPEDHYERKIVVSDFPGDYQDDAERKKWAMMLDHSNDVAIEKMSAQYDKLCCPKEPRKPNVGNPPAPSTALVDDFKQKKKWQVYVSLFVLFCTLCSGGLFSGDAFSIIFNLVLIGGCSLVIYRFYKAKEHLEKADAEVSQKAIESYEQDKIEKEQKYEEDMKEYQLQMNSFTLAKADFMESYAGWREVYLQSLEEEAEIEGKLEADRLAAVEKIKAEEMMPVAEELVDLNDLVTDDYFPVLDDIISLLKNGRADDLKEAINLYEDIVYREKELQLEREKERNRQYEAEQQMRMQEKQHREQMRFQEEQERQRKNEAQQQMRMQEKQHQDQMNFQKNQEMQRKREAAAGRQKRCAWCACYPSCGMINQEAAYNCTGFRPR